MRISQQKGTKWVILLEISQGDVTYIRRILCISEVPEWWGREYDMCMSICLREGTNGQITTSIYDRLHPLSFILHWTVERTEVE